MKLTKPKKYLCIGDVFMLPYPYYNKKNKTTKYVVVNTEFKSQFLYSGKPPIDVYKITARKLKKNYKYNPRGAKIVFYQTPGFFKSILDINAIGYLKKPKKILFTDFVSY